MRQFVSPPSLRGQRVVICEDEGVTVMLLRKGLQRAGLNIVGEAATADQAVDLVLNTRPDIVVMDERLACDSYGTEAIGRFLPRHPCCVVMLSGARDLATQIGAIEAGAAGFLVKPVDLDRLLTILPEIWENYLLAQSSAGVVPSA